jgi:hypothetical protein
VIYVVSAPRSGLNWLRYCIEHYLGVKTPGKDVLIKGDAAHQPVFIRAHNARRGSNRNKGQPLITLTGPEDKVLLLLRDPLETFVRAAGRSFRRYRGFVENIRYFNRSSAASKHAAYYEDQTARPEAMLETMAFLAIAPAPGHALPSLAALTADWQQLGAASRAGYDVRQAHGGGAMTRSDPANFRFHQRALTDAEKQRVWRYLQRHLAADELRLLARYLPPEGIAKAGPLTLLGDYVAALR